MKSKTSPKGARRPKSSVSLVPPPPTGGSPVKATGKRARLAKRPVDPREFPAARDSRGKASRTEIRREGTRISSPRQSNRPAERAGQSRSHKRGSRRTAA